MRAGEVAYEATRNNGLTHSQTAMCMVEDALESLNMEPSDVDVYAAVTGPGSFTGVRIGVCAARAMAHATGKPAVGIDALMALAAQAHFFPGLICPVLDARRDQVYCAAFRWGRGALPEQVMNDAALSLTDFVSALPEHEPVFFLGDGLHAHEKALTQALGERAHLAPAHMRYLRAASACYLASHMTPGDYRALAPTYLRAPQAERERAAREKANG
jgi:tRNA threonylcarbamoyladenosine biosynthesis protein TsaB